MANAKAKTINILLEEGNLKGVVSVQDSYWNSGELYSAPRESVDDLIALDVCKKFGVYLLISDSMVYVGQSQDLSKRIKQHKSKKDWWDRVIIITTSDDSLNRSDIDYLESLLIKKAGEIELLDCDNRKKGNLPKVDRFNQVRLDQYLEEALFLLEFIGVKIFSEMKELISTPQEHIEIAGKGDAKKFLNSKGISVGKNWNYGKMQSSKGEFWLNPKVTAVEEDWEIVLNNQDKKELIYLSIPQKTFRIQAGKRKGFVPRKDKPIYIDMNISVETLIDRRSKYDLSSYVVEKYNY